MSGRMTSKRNKDRNQAKKPTVEHLAKATFGTENFNSVKKPKMTAVTFDTESPGHNQTETFNRISPTDNFASPLRPSRVDSIVGMEKNEAGHERLIE